jgi:hypothetical protein
MMLFIGDVEKNILVTEEKQRTAMLKGRDPLSCSVASVLLWEYTNPS